ncbi:MAG: nucleoside triphosphate pyrophosphohydrolase [Bacteroidota bacterium]
MNSEKKRETDSFRKLLEIMDELRVKCPWDSKQTYDSLRHLTIEETYELADAILDKDPDEIRKELGDLLLHIVFYAKIAEDEKRFNIADVIDGICEKLIIRHPHIFSDTKVKDDEEVKQNWEKIKLREGKKSVLDGVPKSLPSMVKAYRIQDKARGVGFDWDNAAQVWEKVIEELNELKHEVEAGNKEKAESELGDLLFAVINYARFINVEPDAALEKTNRKFIRRFSYMEECLQKEGKKLSEMKLEEMDQYWNKAKDLEC